MTCRFLIIITFIPFRLFAQEQIIIDAINDYTTSRLWAYEEIQVEWNMQGDLQIDLNEGINYLFENQPTVAEENLTRALEKNGKLWPAYYYRGIAKKLQRRLKEAQFDIQSALTLNSMLYEGYVELAKIQYLSLQIQESEKTIKRAIALDPNRPTAYYIRGDINLAQLQKQKAKSDYETCLEVSPDFLDARVKLALLESMNGSSKENVIRQLDQVLEVDSLNKGALLIHALLSYEHNKKQADKDLSYLIQADPNALLPYLLRGTLLTELNDFERAFSDFQKLSKATEKDENAFQGMQTSIDKKIDIQNAGAYLFTRLYGLSDRDRESIKEGYCYLFTGQYELALSNFQTLNNNEEPLVTYLKALTFEHMGAHQQAYHWYIQTRKLDNDIADVHKKLGIYQQELKQWTLSIISFDQVLELTPDAFYIYKIRGLSYYNLEDYESAIDDFTRYIFRNSNDREVFGFRAMANQKSGRQLDAYADFSRAGYEKMLNFPEIIRLADQLLQHGDTVSMVSSLEPIVSIAPYFTEGYCRLMKVKVKKGQWEYIQDNIAKATANCRKDASDIDYSYLLTIEAMIQLQNKDVDSAIGTLEKAIRQDSRNALAYLQRGKLYLDLGKKSKAEPDLRKASALGNSEANQLVSKSFQ